MSTFRKLCRHQLAIRIPWRPAPGLGARRGLPPLGEAGKSPWNPAFRPRVVGGRGRAARAMSARGNRRPGVRRKDDSRVPRGAAAAGRGRSMACLAERHLRGRGADAVSGSPRRIAGSGGAERKLRDPRKRETRAASRGRGRPIERSGGSWRASRRPLYRIPFTPAPNAVIRRV